MVASVLLLLAFVGAVAAPDTTLGKALRQGLIESPARAFSRLTLRQTIMGLIVFLIVVGIAVSAPEFVALFGFSDLSFYVDVAVVAMLMSAVVRLKSVIEHTARLSSAITARLISRLRQTKPRNRHRHSQRPKPPSSTDESEPAWGWAFA